jgi:3-ketosteroid 9alpha-monooxygenase subunit A
MNAPLERLPIHARSPLPPYTQGWYCVADSHEVEIDKMLPVTYLGEQFVVYRTPDGVAHVADAFCPHLGAHVASHDGKMENGEIVCPFHKWRFDGQTGLCNSVPYSEKPAGKVGLKVYPTKEILGLVLMYFDPMGRPPESLPTYENNILNEGKWIKYVEKSWIMYAHPQEFLENIFDPAHLTQLHSGTVIPTYDLIEDTPYGLHLKLGFPEAQEYPVESIDVYYAALSYNMLHFKGTGFEVVPVVNFTPIDEERTLQHVRLYVKDTGNDQLNQMIGGAFSDRFILEVEQDLKVLDFKKHIVNPKLCLGDGPIYQFRRYAQKFYPEAAV